MELKHLKLVKAVFEKGSLVKAAEVLFLTQSALSHQLKELESELGILVFHRIHKRLVITEAGKIVYKHAINILDRMEDLMHDLELVQRNDFGKIRLSMEAYSSYYWLPPILEEFGKDYPNVEIELIIDENKRPYYLLQEGKVDLALTVMESHNPIFNVKTAFSDEVVAVVSTKNELSKKKYLVLTDFDDQILFTHSSEAERNRILERTSISENLKPKLFKHVALTETILDLVSRDAGTAILSKWAIKPYVNETKVKLLPLTELGSFRNWFLVSLGTENSEPLSSFKEILLRHLNYGS